MSSSEDENLLKPVKVVKRRKRTYNVEKDFQAVNLYSHKVTPALNKTNQSLLEAMNKDLHELPAKVLKPTTGVILDHTPTEIQQSDDVEFVCEMSPTKPKPVTPPPQQPTLPSKVNRRMQSKRLKLLSNVASVVLQAKQGDLNQSIDSDCTNVDNASVETFIMVKVRFRCQIYKYPMIKDSCFKEVFDHLAKDIRTDKDLLLLVLNDRQIDVKDTPESIGLSIVDFIDAVLLENDALQQSRKESNNNVDCINVHFQCKFQKHKKSYSVNKYKAFNETMKKYADALDYDVKKLRFVFDGDVINGAKTAEELEIENDDCLDVMRIDKKR